MANHSMVLPLIGTVALAFGWVRGFHIKRCTQPLNSPHAFAIGEPTPIHTPIGLHFGRWIDHYIGLK